MSFLGQVNDCLCSFWLPHLDTCLAQHFEVRLHTHKSHRSGQTHAFHIFANDLDCKICPFRLLVCLSRLFGVGIQPIRSLFPKLNNQDVVLYRQSVVSNCLLAFLVDKVD